MPIFIETEDQGFYPQLFMLCAYGYILFLSANLIGDGCEIMLNYYGAGIVGGLLIPILGAVPDGMMILMSGMGDGSKEEIQEELSVGIGTLAGSTIMLLTVPLGLGIYLNRREMGANGRAATKRVVNPETHKTRILPVVPDEWNWTNCATVYRDTPVNAVIMMAVSLTLLVVQVPALVYNMINPGGDEAVEVAPWAFAGFVISMIFFFAYCAWSIISDQQEKVIQAKTEFSNYREWLKSDELRLNYRRLGGNAKVVFERLDQDNDGFLSEKEVFEGLERLGYTGVTKKQGKFFFRLMDSDQNGRVQFEEWEEFVQSFVSDLAHKEYTKMKDPGDPDVFLRNEIKLFMDDSKRTEMSRVLGKRERHQMHVWLAKNYPKALQTYSTDLPGEDLSSSDHRTLCVCKVGTSVETDPYKVNVRVTKHLAGIPRWAHASDKLIAEFRRRRDYGFEKMWSELPHKHAENVLTWAEFESTAKKFQLDVSHASLKILFNESAINTGRTVITQRKFRSILESLVQVSTSTSRRRMSRAASKSMVTKALSISQLTSYQTDDEKINHKCSSDDDEGDSDDDDEGDEAEEVELPDFMNNWSEDRKRTMRICYAVLLLLLGTVIVSVFSDPMVDVLNSFGHTIGVNPFYVSFIVTPLASNASEVICGLQAAARKTNRQMSVCACALYGAATMNCTFCLSIFLGLVYFRGLSWDYTAEVAAILVVIWVVGILGLKDTFTMVDAVIIAALFPVSIVMIWFMENVLHIN